MNWKMKGWLFRALAAVPFGQHLYNVAQRRILGTAFQEITPALLRLHNRHVANFQGAPPGRVMEFGGGRDLLSPLLMSQAGATEILVFDIDRHCRPDQVNHCIRQLRKLQPGEWPEVADCEGDLFAKYRIRYIAPGDARATALPNACVSFVMSTSTLEHIGVEDIRRIHSECLRVTAPGAVLSHIVDYTDHYRYTDSSIGMFNFYQFADAQWRWWNPPNHPQNRIRHAAMKDLLVVPGVQPVEITAHTVPASELEGLELAPRFRALAQQDLLTQCAYFTLQRT